jgi:Methyltransferase domain
MFDLAAQLDWLDRVEEYRPEYETISADPVPGEPDRYYWRNTWYTSGDGELLHAMIRILRPGMVVEVGSGHSTRCIAGADDGSCHHIAIDPRPRVALPPGVEHIARPVQEVRTSVFELLGPDDVLFIDAAHRYRPGNAVADLYGRVLPAIRSGVVVHIHDIFLPAEYPARWVDRRYDEQEVLARFLAERADEWEVLVGASFLHVAARERMAAAFPSYDATTWPSAFWMRRR